MTAATDGHIALWPMGELVKSAKPVPEDVAAARDSPWLTENHVLDTTMQWQSRHRLHQNTIQSLCCRRLSATCVLVVTGGDDSALCLTIVRAITGTTTTTTTLAIPSAHAAAISACAILPDLPSSLPRTDCGTLGSTAVSVVRVVTAGKDQRVKMWDVSVDLSRDGVEGLEVEKVTEVHTHVADVSCMAVLERDGEGPEGRDRILLCGIGMEVLVVEV